MGMCVSVDFLYVNVYVSVGGCECVCVSVDFLYVNVYVSVGGCGCV